jgi:hypothetical protein
MLEEVLWRMPEYTIDVHGVRQCPTTPLVNGYIAMPAKFTLGKRVLTGFDEHLLVQAAALSGRTGEA